MKKSNSNKNKKENKPGKKSKSEKKYNSKKKHKNKINNKAREYILSLLNISENDQDFNSEEKDTLNSKTKFQNNEEKIEIEDKKVEKGEEQKEGKDEEKKEKYHDALKSDLDNYIKEINEYLLEEQQNLTKEENKIEIEIPKKKMKKVNTIEVEEFQSDVLEQFLPKKNNVVEVKDKLFKINEEIPKEINYEGKLFIKDRHQGKTNSNEINYRCKNNRKDERIRKTAFCNALIKRKTDKKNVYFTLENQHSKECNDLFIIDLKNETNLIGNYTDFINKCFAFLDSTEIYNRKEFTVKLLQIYNENKYNFKLKENTIKNIIGRWKNISLRFTKYNAIENKYNKKDELILWDYTNTVIYTSNKKNPISCEYFIWTTDQIIARIRNSQHFFVDATFHHPKGYSQLLIIIFKDIISKEYYPGFYILMTNKTEILYDLIFKSVIRIISQQNA